MATIVELFGNEQGVVIGVYCIVNKVNGWKYIGSSDNVIRRWNNHVSKLNRNEHHNRHLQRAWNKYGVDSFTFGMLEVCDIDELHEREQWNLDNWPDLYNIAPHPTAPMKGRRHTPESRRKISKSLRGNTYTLGYKHSKETRRKMSLARKGRPQSGGVKKHTEEAKRKISAAGRGREVSNETRQKISKANQKCIAQIDPVTNEVIRIWDSQTEASRHLGIGQQCISSAVLGRKKIIKGREYTQKTAGGFRWEFV